MMVTAQKIVKAISVIAITIVIIAPVHVFGLLFELLHLLFELLLEAAHLLFEFVELVLDHLIEFLLETDLHNTQVIVFYIILAMLFLLIRRVCRAIPPLYRRSRDNLVNRYQQKKMDLQVSWLEMTWFDKLKMAVIVMAAFICFFFFGL